MKFTKETAKRMLRTFLQAALAYIAVNIAVVDFSAEKAVLKSKKCSLFLPTIGDGISDGVCDVMCDVVCDASCDVVCASILI
jgi:hypothetical protein